MEDGAGSKGYFCGADFCARLNQIWQRRCSYSLVRTSVIIYEITAVLSGAQITSSLFSIFFLIFFGPEIRVDLALEGRAPSRPFGHVKIWTGQRPSLQPNLGCNRRPAGDAQASRS